MNNGFYDAEIAHTFYSPFPPIRRDQWSAIRHAEPLNELPVHLECFREYYRLTRVAYNDQGAILSFEDADETPTDKAQIPLVHLAIRTDRIFEIDEVHKAVRNFEDVAAQSRWGVRTLLGNLFGELPEFRESEF